jgi:hypothetical protein
MAPARFSATIVTFHPDAALLERALRSLGEAIAQAQERGLVTSARVFIVDNGDASSLRDSQAAARAFAAPDATLELVHGHGNVCYGRANNLVLPRLESEVHLVMNTDVELDRDANAASIEALQSYSRFGLVAHAAVRRHHVFVADREPDFQDLVRVRARVRVHRVEQRRAVAGEVHVVVAEAGR